MATQLDLRFHECFLIVQEEYYKRFLLDIQSRVYVETSKVSPAAQNDIPAQSNTFNSCLLQGILQDEQAIGRLESLRMACCHPQVLILCCLGFV